MRKTWIVAVAVISLAFAAVAAMTDEDRALQKGRSAAYEMSETVREKLQDSMDSSGPAGAMKVCAYQARALADEVSARHGVTARRTSLRLRNPRNAPDPYEKELLARLQEQFLAGTMPKDVFEASEADGRRGYRYTKPLKIVPACLPCHGGPQEIPGEVRELLEERYPGDQATGYRAGELRGIVSVFIPAE